MIRGRFLHAGLGILIGSRNCLYTRMLEDADDTGMTCVTPNEEGTRHGLRRVTPYDKNWTQAQMLGNLLLLTVASALAHRQATSHDCRHADPPRCISIAQCLI